MTYNEHIVKNMDRNDKQVRITLHGLAVFLTFSIFFMPDYFGVSVLNSQRITLILIWIIIFRNEEKRKKFMQTVMEFRYNGILLVYIGILLMTALYRVDVGTITNPVGDQIAVLYTMMYLFKEELSIKEFLKIIIAIAYVLCILGILEYVTEHSLFDYMELLDGMRDVRYRDGSYRVMGPAHHALGYGLYLLIMLPISCYKYEDKEFQLFNRIGLLFLIFINVYLTGSRSTLGLMLGEIAVIFLLCEKKHKKTTFLAGVVGGSIVLVLMTMFKDTTVVQQIVLTFAKMLDGVLGTNFMYALGVDVDSYSWSTRYREILPLIFKLDWINPWVGRGYGYDFNWSYNGFFVNSIDNYYINQYIKVAYPGLIIQVIFYILFFIKTAVSAFLKGSYFARTVLVSFLFYFINLYWVDALGTLDYIFVLFAAIYVLDQEYDLMHKEKSRKNNM